jgi:putative ergosteryl-3beta-O-L-aspartate hydrolase
VLEVDAVVVGVNYCLTSKHPFPTAVEDGMEAILLLTEHADDLGLDMQRIAVSGFSVGGNLACTVPMRLQDQLLRLSNTESGDGDAESIRKMMSGRLNFLWPTDFKIVPIIAW